MRLLGRTLWGGDDLHIHISMGAFADSAALDEFADKILRRSGPEDPPLPDLSDDDDEDEDDD
jgi:hypothetical protein